jgi:hypothetical protein
VKKTNQKVPNKTNAKNDQKNSKPSKNKNDFIEGELVNVGQIGLLPFDNHFGLLMGLERLGEVYYGSVSLGLNHNFKLFNKPLKLTVSVPLRFELLDARPDRRFNQLGRFRQEDWDEVSDFAKVIQRLQFGGKEQPFYLDIDRFSSHTIGHGVSMKRYDANLNFNTSRVGVQFDAFSDYIGFESMLNDLVNPNIMGGLVFIKPLSIINRQNYLLRSFSIGVSTLFDINAPLRNHLDLDDVDQDGRRESELKINQDNFQPIALQIPVNTYGIDAEIKLFDHRSLDWKMYVDYSFLESGLPTEDGLEVAQDQVATERVRSGGFTWGHLIRSNLGVDPIHALRFILEYRNYDHNYLPSYFDALYEIQRVQYIPNGSLVDLANSTKLQRVLGRDPNGERIHGGYLEANWKVGNAFALSTGLEFNSATPDNHLFVHLELPQLGSWQFSTTYHRRNAQSVSDLFNVEFADNDIWLLQTRYKMASWLHSNLSVMTPFGFGPESVFRNAVQVNLGVEIGFSYDR